MIPLSSSVLLAPATVAWLLITARLWAIIALQPAWRLLVGPWWTVVAAGLAGVLATVLAPLVAVPAQAPASLIELLPLVAVELSVGGVLGLLASLPAYAAIGATTASAVVLRVPPKPVVALGIAIILATTLSLGLHRPLIAAALDTLRVVPLGELPLTQLHPADVGRAAHTMLLLALSLLTPALLAGLVFEVAVRLVGRGCGPAPAVGTLAPWFRLAAATIALGATWSTYAHRWAQTMLPS